MQPTYISIGQLFGAQTRHTVPLFQRPYVWTREDQWEPLWDDLKGLIGRVAARDGDAHVAGHFLGTVVLDQASNATGSLPRREVIDGQQRLTTLQLLLKAAEHALLVIESTAVDDDNRNRIAVAKRQIGFLTENPAYGSAEERYKVWPTNEDRAPFREVMDGSETGGVKQTSRMTEAYAFFRQAFISHLAGSNPGDRAQTFVAALKDHLRLIVLDLDDTDEPQAIFETLNAHGTPLLPADLMKNWLLWEASRQRIPPAPLYETHWIQFDRRHEYWRERVGVGHAARARVDTFLQNWLTKEVREQVSAKHLYDRFLRYVTVLKATAPLDVSELMSSIKADAERYERIDTPTGTSRIDILFSRLKILDIIVFHPVLLALLGRSGSDQTDLDEVAVALESYLVRRMVCGYQTRGYGTLALALLKAIAELPLTAPAAETVKAHLVRDVSGNDAWPDDAMFLREWRQRRFYGGLRRDRVLMILRAIEEEYQRISTKAEPLMTFDYSQLQVEHILPQKWQQHWPLSGDENAGDRDWALHGIGNLTLVSEKLNPSLSNAPWRIMDGGHCKRDALDRHTRLELNRKLLAEHGGSDWNEASMRKRAEGMFETAKIIWPA